MSTSCASSSRTAKAFTLIEVLVASTLTLLLIGLCFSFLIPALRHSRHGAVQAELQQMATLSMRKLVDDIEKTNYSGISLCQDPVVLAIHPLVDVTPAGRRVYADELVVYFYDSANQVLKRRTWPPEPPAGIPVPGSEAALRLTGDQLKMFPGASSRARSMANSLVEFEITHAGTAGFLQLPLKVRMVTESGSGRERERFELVRTITLRNQL
ncbi:MAG: prepilin-type N-terminal cleavage/methylation domain-containing protein [Candidatus Eremiobacteraeota bacterium]|nr:prepilin-type N-terminal cleavage/methylation domain-containing protein [Candidatus Eremiobacteraeota bacterium]